MTIKEIIDNNVVSIVRCNPADRYYVVSKISGDLPNLKQWNLCDSDLNKKPIENLMLPLNDITSNGGNLILEDFLTALSTIAPFEQQCVLDLISRFCISSRESRIIILQTDNQDIPEVLTNLSEEYYWPLPTRSEIADLCVTMGLSPDPDLISTGTGLCYEDLRKGLSQALATYAPIISLSKYRDRRLALRSISIMPIPDFTEIAGLDLFQEEIKNVAFCFSEQGRALNLPFPKGQLLMGPPGTGKTHASLAVASILKFPVLNVSADVIISGGISGLRQIILTAVAISPCVLLLDEIEKLFGESKNQQLFGYLLTFMNENTSPIFILGTLNRPEKLEISIKRNGRIDECWFFTYPDELDRKECICVFLKRYGIDPLIGDDAFSDAEWSMVARSTNFFVPDEIKRVVEKTILAVRSQDPAAKITANDIAVIADNHSTMFKQDEMAVLDMINAVRGKARPAQSPGRKLPTFQEYDPHAPLKSTRVAVSATP
jgi:ATP-dependent 26S proteasome regulatory subunit